MADGTAIVAIVKSFSCVVSLTSFGNFKALRWTASLICRPSRLTSKCVGILSGAHKTSMLQDLEAGRPMEIDPLLTVVQEMGRLIGQATPTIDTVLALIKLREQTAQRTPIEVAALAGRSGRPVRVNGLCRLMPAACIRTIPPAPGPAPVRRFPA